jgi:hypothetical protein
LVEKLSTLGIGDAEQVVAVAAIPDARSEPQQVLDLKDKAFQDSSTPCRACCPRRAPPP